MVQLSVINDRPLLRQCGGCTHCCTHCCTTLAVKEFGKPYHCRCEHQQERGCKVYKDRPVECKAFECLWYAGMGSSQDHPELLGLLFAIRLDNNKLYVDIHELKPGVLKDTRNEDMDRLMEDAQKALPEWAYDIFGGFCFFLHGFPISTAFPIDPKYPAGPCGELILYPVNPRMNLYIGPADELKTDEDRDAATRKAMALV